MLQRSMVRCNTPFRTFTQAFTRHGMKKKTFSYQLPVKCPSVPICVYEYVAKLPIRHIQGKSMLRIIYISDPVSCTDTHTSQSFKQRCDIHRCVACYASKHRIAFPGSPVNIPIDSNVRNTPMLLAQIAGIRHAPSIDITTERHLAL